MVTGTIPLFVRFRRQATLNIILSRFRIYRLNSLRPVSLTMISPISSNIWSFAKALEFLWLIRAPISWYWKKERSRTITHLLICWKTWTSFDHELFFFLQHDHVLSNSPHHRAKSRTLAHEFEQFCDFDRSSPEAPISTIRMSFYILNENTKICATNRNKI